MEEPQKPELTALVIDGPPWEKKHEVGFFVAFFETLKAFLLHPAHTFSVMRRTGGLGDALIYTVAIQVFTFLWMFSLSEPNPEMIFDQFPELNGVLELPDNFGQIMVLIYPISVILLQFIGSLGLHLALRIRNLQNYEFSLIFRMTAYSAGTASLLVILPVVGGMLSMAMTLYLLYIGLRTIYGLEPFSYIITLLIGAVIMIGLYFGVAIGITILLIILSFLL